ncbi:MAG TPA: Crp/Fnr family transcriptional regulator [Blastocatellia bacterium]|nr:Crp/Fnr family transcriptional regulator [Blastocatellia bacterium]
MKTPVPPADKKPEFRRNDPDFSLACAGTSEELSLKSEARVYPAGTELLRQGSSPHEIYLIEQGLIKLVSISDAGREVIISLRYPGWLLGAPSALVREPYPATAVTLTRCRLRRISADALIDLARTDALFSWQLHQAHSREILDHVDRVVQLGESSSIHRLRRLLRQLVSAMGSGEGRKDIRVPMPMKHAEMARFIAVSPEHLSRLLRQLQEDGIIRRQKGWIIVSDLEYL